MSVDALLDKLADHVASAASDLAREVVDDIRQDLSSAYPPRSEPGKSPHRRTGALAAETESRPPQRDGDRVTVDVVNSADYARHLEYGTERMAARPFMRPALERWTPKWAERAKAAAARK